MKEEAWVIQRDDGRYLQTRHWWNEGDYRHRFTEDITDADFISFDIFDKMETINKFIKDLHLENCKPVRVEIKIVEEV